MAEIRPFNALRPIPEQAAQLASRPYDVLNSDHLLYDLVYNPAETKFMRLGKQYGATTKNGLKMLELQAEAAWQIWNS